jgi:hypothetical protein
MTACIICLEREPYGRSLICGGDFARLRGDLATVQWAHSWLGTSMLALPASWKPGTIHRRGGPQPPMNVAMHDVRVDITGKLATWARMVAEEMTPAMAGPAHGDVRTVATWLRAQLGWISDQPWCDEFARELTDMRSAAYALAPWERSRLDLPLPCPRCGLLSLSLYSGDDAVTCRIRDCGHALTWADYQRKVGEEWTRQTDLQRATVAA